MLEKEFKYYLENQSEFVQNYKGQYLVIKGEDIIGIFDSENEAYFETLKKHKEGTFLIQLCEEGDGSYTQSFHSRVIFS